MTRLSPEILAPAGNFDALEAALRCGADAIYLGGRTLNARRGADNFTDEELPRAAALCHARGAKLYLTLNTLISDEETDELASAIERACAIGADALILQDLAAARAAKRLAPDMPLHASTQMSVQTAAGLSELAELGFTRAVVPRELSFEELSELAEVSPIELEVFVHGALCMSVSGQCLISAVLGSRSGNRGLCAQPCRLDFRSGDFHNALSLKDMTFFEHYGELAGIGVASLKIEGRMKRPEYVAAAASACVSASRGTYSPEERERLQSVFSRSGFTDGYFTGRLGEEMFGFRRREDVVSAAGVLKELEGLYRTEMPRVKTDFYFRCRAGEPPSLTVTALGRSVTESLARIPQEAQKLALTPDKAAEQLTKCGGTQFFAGEMNSEIDGGLFLPASELNSLRRAALEALNSELEKPVPKPFAPSELFVEDTVRIATVPKLHARFSYISQLPSDTSMLDRIYLRASAPPKDFEELISRGLSVAAELPRGVMGREGEIKTLLDVLKKSGVTRVSVGGLDTLRLAREADFDITAGIGTNIFNRAAADVWRERGAEDIIASVELRLPQISELAGVLPLGVAVYGYLPLMLMRNCPVRNGVTCAQCGKNGELTDRLGTKSPVECEGGFAELENSRPLWMADRLNEVRGADFFYLRFTRESAYDCEKILDAYLTGGECRGEFTRGLYYRGVE